MKTSERLRHLTTRIGILALLLTSPALFAADPVLFFSDLDWGPRSGWEGSASRGAAVTIWGKNFGSSRGGSYVTINGAPAAEYAEWGAAGPARGLERITFWVSSSSQDGDGQITVTVGGVTSNALPFRVMAGVIYFIAPTGSNSNNGLYTTAQGGVKGPFRDIYMFNPGTLSNGQNPSGDGQYIVYVRGGNYSRQDVDEAFVALRGPYGGENKRKALIGYPGETPVLNALTASRGVIWTASYSPYGRINYFTYAKLRVEGGTGAYNLWGDYTRVVGNYMKDMLAETWSGVVMVDNSQYSAVYGNLFEHCGYDSYKHNIYVKTHPDYVSGDKSVDQCQIGWNEFADAVAGSDARGGVIFISRAGGTSGKFTRNVFVHDCYFRDGNMDFIYVGDSQDIGDVFVYNNLFRGGTSINGGITLYAGTNNIYFYNNTFYKIGPANQPMIWGTELAHAFFKNNIWYCSSGQLFSYLETWRGATFNYDHDLFYDPDGSTALPSGANITVTSCRSGDPKFTNATGNDFHLLQTSPAIDAGLASVNTLVTRDYDGNKRPQGSIFDLGANEYITVTAVQPFAITPTSLDFGSLEALKTLQLSNNGSTALSWTASGDQAWLSVKPASGTLQLETALLKVTVDRRNRAAGSYSGSVNIVTGSGTTSVGVLMNCVPDTIPPARPQGVHVLFN
ncbi:MAG TPA: choice-of-anchor Q domain-containing protein [bacterium]|nr:choice-of-anchor Q domain-containing protein [bacterium]HPR88354.1 choice-of-anchor Q domain-containing protein [bacterium]